MISKLQAEFSVLFLFGSSVLVSFFIFILLLNSFKFMELSQHLENTLLNLR